MNVFAAAAEFRRFYGQQVGESPHLLDFEREFFAMELIQEEAAEFDEALHRRDLVAAAKELADLFYVLAGMAVEMGLPMDEIIGEVHKSNLTKLGEDGKPIYREDGKVLKGPNYKEPDIAGVLRRHGWQGESQ